jgi:porphobilinogen synthase
MEGVKRYGINVLLSYLDPLVNNLGLKSVLLFPVPSEKGLDACLDPEKNPLVKAIPLLRSVFPSLLIITDVCLCAWTDTGHCCIFDPSTHKMDNSKSVKLLSDLSVCYAKAGANIIAPSDMMDGRIGAIRTALNEIGFNDVAVMSYAAKFASSFYGPFRDAAGSAPSFGDRKSYQLPPGSSGLGMRAVERDISEGADFIMIKPGLPYLDIVKEISLKHPHIPLAIYHVSGEYAMLKHASNAGALDLKTALFEVLTSFKRAGASIIITYFTPDILANLKFQK